MKCSDTTHSTIRSCAQGRAIYILEQTLPDFFQVGLVSNIDLTRPEIINVPLADNGNIEGIYSPTIRLTYTPPAALPPPFPRTLSLEGEHDGAGVASLLNVHQGLVYTWRRPFLFGTR